ncbi:MAG: toprim domain-containing protein [Thermodesulfovibrionales bacterium]|nr:toprim domain-containing protein [Thermodesulfovibrionales bacterium]
MKQNRSKESTKTSAKLRRKMKYQIAFEKENTYGHFIPDIERAERLKETLLSLYEINKKVPIIVEGKRDVLALKKLGFIGEIITIHSGKNLYEFCESILQRNNKVILLLDWDKTGETLYRKLQIDLKGLWEEFAPLRDFLKILCQKDISHIEDIPSLLNRLVGIEIKLNDIDTL